MTIISDIKILDRITSIKAIQLSVAGEELL
jgi:hypothetical protein